MAIIGGRPWESTWISRFGFSGAIDTACFDRAQTDLFKNRDRYIQIRPTTWIAGTKAQYIRLGIKDLTHPAILICNKYFDVASPGRNISSCPAIGFGSSGGDH